jgi:hypothetical protein
MKSSDFVFFFRFNNFSFHYTIDYEKNKKQNLNSNRISLETIKYLISKGYDIPIYNNSNMEQFTILEQCENKAILFTKNKLKLVDTLLSDDYKIGYKEGIEHYIASKNNL